ncbi:glutaredoxin 3 [Marinobacterium sp. AK62]|uniref:Glutaredoxin n=1 Tax=Marinobacterium alkalitolerans TaxID=1542925 RepID=A0ABS3Z5V7_9GAMM|nr:glutaredoxin 3 [Marinobacterium alkalitolerans]MBP0047103.1 glutaredoxin 3 [Marinobacterium alkalitolerans]
MAKTTIYLTRWCPFCTRALALLDSKQVEYEAIDVDAAPELRQEMMTRSQRRTVPQIFIGETHVGGCDELFALEREGKLDALLNA